jgi:hypothetical protein
LSAWLNIFFFFWEQTAYVRNDVSRGDVSTEDDCTAKLSQNKRFPAGILTGQKWLRCTSVGNRSVIESTSTIHSLYV